MYTIRFLIHCHCRTLSILMKIVHIIQCCEFAYSNMLRTFLQVLNKEFLGMQALIDKARAEGEAALAEAFNNKMSMQEQYEKVR